MAKRTTISIPDELYEKMNKWRDHINFSKEFRNHVSNLIEARESFLLKTKGNKKMANTIARLKAEKVESLGDYRQIGRDYGYDWAEEADYVQLRAILDWEPNTNDDLPQGEARDELREYFHSIYQEDENLDRDDWWYGRNNFLNEQFILGWKEGVDAFWDKVKDHLE